MKITAYSEEYAYRLATGAVTAGSPAGGDLSGAYPTPTVSAVAGVTIASNNPLTVANYAAVLLTTSSNTAAWTALGSNTPINVAEVGSPGGGPMPGFWDHVHGVSFGSNATTVSSVSAAGASPSNSRADHVHVGVASVAVASNTFSGPLTFTTPGNTVGITSPAAGTLAFTAPSGGGGGGGGVSLQVKETDGAPDVTGVTQIIVSAGTLTNNGGGSVTITTGGGGGWPVDPAPVPDAADVKGTIAVNPHLNKWGRAALGITIPAAVS